MNPDQTFGIVLVLIIGALILAKTVLGPIGRALARRLDPSAHGLGSGDAELSDLRARLAELEERVDFTERVLLHEREQERIGEGGSVG